MRSYLKKLIYVDLVLCYLMILFPIAGWYQGDEDLSAVTAASAEDPYQDVGKKVALTFDDGPNPDYTEELLAGLKERGVHATFFLLGQEVEKYPEIVKKIYEDGHTIGNHSYRHELLSKLDDSQACQQVERTNQLIYDVTGEYPMYLRPPYGDWKDHLDCATTMIEVLWDVDPRDWATGNPQAVVKRVVNNVKEGDIILMHDASASSVAAALKIVDELTQRGFTFVSVGELLLE